MAPKRKAAKGVDEAIAKVSRSAGNKRKNEEEYDEQPVKKSIQEQREAARHWRDENLPPVKSPAKSPAPAPAKKEPVRKEPVKKTKAIVYVEEEEEEEEEEVRPPPRSKPQRQAIAAAAREHIRETHGGSPARRESPQPTRKEVSNKSTKVAASANLVRHKSQLSEPEPAYKLILQIILFALAFMAFGLLAILAFKNREIISQINKFSPVSIEVGATKGVDTVIFNSHDISANIIYLLLVVFGGLALTLAII